MTEGHDIDIEPVSSYLRYLPAPLQDGRFIGRFLLAFEAILSGGVATVDSAGGTSGPDAAQEVLLRMGKALRGDDRPEHRQGLGETLDGITRYFQPQETPADFLPWLAQWVAIDLRQDWSDDTRRNVIASIVPLYKLRGTRRGIEQVLRLCVSETANVYVDDSNCRDYCFQVVLVIGQKLNPLTLQQLYRKVEAAIELQKPAHTYYSLRLVYPSLRLLDVPDPENRATEGVYVGMNTTLGNVPMDMSTGEKLPLADP